MRCLLFGLTAFLGFGIAMNPETAVAGFILNPSGTLLTDNTLYDPVTGFAIESHIHLNSKMPGFQGFQGSFFGQTKNDVYVSENGYIGFSALDPNQANFIPQRLGNQSVIAPLWDDFLLVGSTKNTGSYNRVIADYSPNSHLVVTWENVRLELETGGGGALPDTSRSMQAVWFEQNTTIRGFDFKANDIAFGYVPHSTTGPAFGNTYGVAGLDKGDGMTLSPVMGTNNGSLRDDSIPSNLLPNNPLPIDENQFVLFRAGVEGMAPVGFAASDFQGGYYRGTFTLTAVPEPSSLGLCCAAVLVTAGAFIRRRWVTAPSSSAMNR